MRSLLLRWLCRPRTGHLDFGRWWPIGLFLPRFRPGRHSLGLWHVGHDCVCFGCRSSALFVGLAQSQMRCCCGQFCWSLWGRRVICLPFNRQPATGTIALAGVPCSASFARVRLRAADEMISARMTRIPVRRSCGRCPVSGISPEDPGRGGGAEVDERVANWHVHMQIDVSASSLGGWYATSAGAPCHCCAAGEAYRFRCAFCIILHVQTERSRLSSNQVDKYTRHYFVNKCRLIDLGTAPIG